MPGQQIPAGNQEVNSALGNFSSQFSCLLQLYLDFYPDDFILYSSAGITVLFLVDTVECEGHLLCCLTRDEDGIPPHILIPWAKFQSMSR